ncbi:MAG: precorrin-6y C5,15-methyltransferase (decarboxylating) subunit CbiE [Candidatus Hydrothermarchaeaceae archaeon]
MGKIFVVGTGPGSRDYLTSAAVRAVKKADVLVGGGRALSVCDSTKPKRVIDRDVDGVISFLRENRGKNIAVLTSGDPGFYSILTRLLEEFPREDLEVIPGISSMQLCFARIKEPWSNAIFLSTHGRETEDILGEVGSGKTMVFLTDAVSPPQRIAEMLLRKDAGDRRVVVGQDLGARNERIVDTTLKGALGGRFSGNSVMVVFYG